MYYSLRSRFGSVVRGIGICSFGLGLGDTGVAGMQQ